MLSVLLLVAAMPWSGRAEVPPSDLAFHRAVLDALATTPDILLPAADALTAVATATGAAHLAFPPTCASGTGRGATLLLPSAAAVVLPGDSLDPGDEVIVVTPEGGCAGAGVQTAEGVAIAIWADDPYTPVVDGLAPGAELRLQVVDGTTGTVHAPETVAVTYTEGYDPSAGFAVNGLYVVAPAGAVGPEPEPGAAELALAASYPNPTSGITTLPFSLPAAADIRLDVFDALGRHVTRAAEGHFEAGTHGVPFDASALASGVYVYRLTAGETFLQRRLVVAR